LEWGGGGGGLSIKFQNIEKLKPWGFGTVSTWSRSRVAVLTQFLRQSQQLRKS
jgi:hypothetical protein